LIPVNTPGATVVAARPPAPLNLKLTPPVILMQPEPR